jgi:hypothetical protein
MFYLFILLRICVHIRRCSHSLTVTLRVSLLEEYLPTVLVGFMGDVLLICVFAFG